MTRRRIKLTFPQDMVKEPLIHLLGKNFEIVSNIRRADVRENMGWVVLELDGEEHEIERGLHWIVESGVRVDPVSGDVVEG
ncbi:MAG: FeS-binding protein [SAR202 cluster bacterium Casp-Chloro-G4]|nr:NIL domain-containing protein [Chloroflexota bacterium]MDA1226850.1 NIL domain-containing protein [Chloroflexota bacterium]PKB60893.1 MAG: FeS-binding protein [SAR202 cluster bacterium Casp-Chloro-G4]